ncbi:hypothetical protein [Klebsiella pneumoniae]|uniref:hypothetical protein n=2 Tax=Klebsiella pneumoniae TaxID=573 RepID=UPI00217DFB1E|nr:hypothetical protein [Klebsiella pneumoniae]MCS6389102.1 hypothetical protein [Klebsiella pneumoniae]HCC6819923.1 hypothetical protein [Klebsiella pneumoniae]HCM1741600.1 hypothetical protein [Klebsiella pneumoniae]
MKEKLSRERIEQYANDPHMCNINAEIRTIARMLLALQHEQEIAEKRIAELESRTVKLPHRNLGHEKLFLLCPFPYYDAEDMEKALAAAGIKVEAE